MSEARLLTTRIPRRVFAVLLCAGAAAALGAADPNRATSTVILDETAVKNLNLTTVEAEEAVGRGEEGGPEEAVRVERRGSIPAPLWDPAKFFRSATPSPTGSVSRVAAAIASSSFG